MTNVELLDSAVERVESDSIRAWVNTEHNRPIWEKMAQSAIDKRGEDADPMALSAYITITAMGM